MTFKSRTTEEAKDALRRLVNSAWSKEPRARFTIPPDLDRDDDIILEDVIADRDDLREKAADAKQLAANAMAERDAAREQWATDMHRIACAVAGRDVEWSSPERGGWNYGTILGQVDVLRAERDAATARAEAAERHLYTCPQCAFSFASEHTDADGSHSCPCCAEARLGIQRAESQAREAKAYDRGRADEREDVIAWLRSRVIGRSVFDESIFEEAADYIARAAHVRTDREKTDG